MGQRKDALPPRWGSAIHQWAGWLHMGGLSDATIRLRRDQISAIARRSKTEDPAGLTLQIIVTQCNRPWSNEYRKSVRTSLVMFCDWCVLAGLMAENPALHLPRVILSPARPRPAPDDVWRQLVEQATPRVRLMARLAGEAGLRRAEIARAHRENLIYADGGWALIVDGKGGKQRVVPLTDDLAAAIRAHCTEGFLFPNKNGGHLTAAYVGTLLSQLMPQGWTAHKLRHRFASRGYAATGNLRAVQTALGHASVATTERYTLVTSRDVRRLVESVSNNIA